MTRERLIEALARTGGASSDADLGPIFAPPPGAVLRPAAVLLAIDAGRIWLTKRATGLKHHPGQIALPGGKIDPTDATPAACALREAREEIGLMPAQLDVLGALPTHETGTGFRITPILAEVTAPFTPRPEPGEVEEVFSVPLSHVLDRRNYLLQERLWAGKMRRYYTVPYGPYYIWGATAHILRGLAERLA